MIRIKRLLAASLVVLATAVPVFAAIKLVSAVPGNHTTGFTVADRVTALAARLAQVRVE